MKGPPPHAWGRLFFFSVAHFLFSHVFSRYGCVGFLYSRAKYTIARREMMGKIISK
jgi:hypothetical protein